MRQGAVTSAVASSGDSEKLAALKKIHLLEAPTPDAIVHDSSIPNTRAQVLGEKGKWL